MFVLNRRIYLRSACLGPVGVLLHPDLIMIISPLSATDVSTSPVITLPLKIWPLPLPQYFIISISSHFIKMSVIPETDVASPLSIWYTCCGQKYLTHLKRQQSCDRSTPPLCPHLTKISHLKEHKIRRCLLHQSGQATISFKWNHLMIDRSEKFYTIKS